MYIRHFAGVCCVQGELFGTFVKRFDLAQLLTNSHWWASLSNSQNTFNPSSRTRKMSAKGKARDKSLSKLGNRMITTMLKNEKLAEKELEKKMKAIKDLERKSMVKICETSLDVKYDIRRKRNTQDMEEQLSEENLNVSFTQGRVLRSPSTSRRGSLRPASPNEEDLDEAASICSQETSISTNPSILINNERKENDSEGDPDSRRSSFGSVQTEAPSPTGSPCGTPPEELPGVDETEAHNVLKVFSQSPRGSRRRRTAPEIADLSPKLLIQLAKSSIEVTRRGSTHDASEDESLAPAQSSSTRRRGSSTAEMMQSKEEKEKTTEPSGQETNFSPSLRKTGSAVVANTSDDRGLNCPPGSPLLLRRRGSSSVTNSKNSLSIELSEALLKNKISEQSQLSPRPKQPISPLVGRRSSGAVAVTLHPISGHPLVKGPNTDAALESMLPDLNGAGPAKRPSSPSMRRSRSPLRTTSLTRPSTARSPSSLSADGVSGEAQSGNIPGTGEYDLGRRRESRPGSARSCYSMPPGGLLLPLDRMPGNLASRRGSEVSSIDLNTLSPTSPLRKAMEDPQATLNPAPVSPSVYRRHSGTVEALQGRVDDFLKTLAAKSS